MTGRRERTRATTARLAELEAQTRTLFDLLEAGLSAAGIPVPEAGARLALVEQRIGEHDQALSIIGDKQAASGQSWAAWRQTRSGRRPELHVVGGPGGRAS